MGGMDMEIFCVLSERYLSGCGNNGHMICPINLKSSWLLLYRHVKKRGEVVIPPVQKQPGCGFTQPSTDLFCHLCKDWITVPKEFWVLHFSPSFLSLSFNVKATATACYVTFWGERVNATYGRRIQFPEYEIGQEQQGKVLFIGPF